MKSIHDKLSEKTDLDQFYGEVQNLPPLLICNQNKAERINPNLLNTSTLLQTENLDLSSLNRNQNDAIYERNLPAKTQLVNIDIRPLSSSICADPRFEKERDELKKYNQYEVNLKCNDPGFMPGRGSIPNFFNNIDVDSELKTINQIDTKCAERFFKIDPKDKKTKLSCYSDTLVKNYKQCEDKVGYQWCDYQKCGKLEQFEKCDSKKFQCPTNQSDLTIYDNMPAGGRLISSEVISNDLLNQIAAKQSREATAMQILEEQEKQRRFQIKTDLELLKQKEDVTLKNNLERHKVEYAAVPEQNDINQFKPNGDLNVYAPIIRTQKVDTARAKNLGKEKALDMKLDMKIKARIQEYERQLGKQMGNVGNLSSGMGYNPNPSNNCNLTTVVEPEIHPFQCRDQTRNLYKFNKLVKNNEDCLFCEQLFNNQTKRKHISVGRVPSHIYTNQ